MERTGKDEKAKLCYGREDEANSRSQDRRSRSGVGKDGGKRGLRHKREVTRQELLQGMKFMDIQRR